MCNFRPAEWRPLSNDNLTAGEKNLPSKITLCSKQLNEEEIPQQRSFVPLSDVPVYSIKDGVPNPTHLDEPHSDEMTTPGMLSRTSSLSDSSRQKQFFTAEELVAVLFKWREQDARLISNLSEMVLQIIKLPEKIASDAKAKESDAERDQRNNSHSFIQRVDILKTNKYSVIVLWEFMMYERTGTEFWDLFMRWKTSSGGIGFCRELLQKTQIREFGVQLSSRDSDSDESSALSEQKSAKSTEPGSPKSINQISDFESVFVDLIPVTIPSQPASTSEVPKRKRGRPRKDDGKR